MYESLEFKIAKNRIRIFEEDEDGERIVKASKQAQDCMDCEAFLQKGIRAIESMVLCEKIFQDALSEEIIQRKDAEALIGQIEVLYRVWIQKSEFSKKWIAKCHRNGYDISNLAEFRACQEQAQHWLERKDWLKRSAKAGRSGFKGEPWDVSSEAGDNLQSLR